MKKILLASTALFASAGFAAAQNFNVGGDGYFGVGFGTYDSQGLFVTIEEDEDGNREDSDYGFIYDLDIDFTLSGESDSGLTFGAATDLDDNASGSQGPRGFEGSIFVSGDFGTLTMGDVDGAAELVNGDLAGVGLSGLGDFNEFIYLLDANENNGPTARYDYVLSSLTLSLGLSDDESFALGVGYATDLFNVGLGYEYVGAGTEISVFSDDGFDAQDVIVNEAGEALGLAFVANDDVYQVIGSAGFSLAGVDLTAIYGYIDVDDEDLGLDTIEQYGISAGYAFDAFSVAAYYRRVDVDNLTAANTENNIYGLGAAYDLGGGLALEAGFASVDLENATSELLIADFGVSVNF